MNKAGAACLVDCRISLAEAPCTGVRCTDEAFGEPVVAEMLDGRTEGAGRNCYGWQRPRDRSFS